jgi:hypothetical protein
MTPEQLAEIVVKKVLSSFPANALGFDGCLSVTVLDHSHLSQWVHRQTLVKLMNDAGKHDDDPAFERYSSIGLTMRECSPNELACAVDFRCPARPSVDGKTVILKAERPQPQPAHRRRAKFKRRPGAA